ncbi:MAG: tetratricopeptide repeat protein [Candidatus Kaelpia imicola]|nr:tetratricopeptide repeat protein [Candidatus Kaelpia imicola]
MKFIGIIASLIIVLLTALIYLDSLDNGFIWDDDVHIYKASYMKSSTGLTDIWVENATPQYYPLTTTIFWLGDKAWGLNPKGYHILSLVIHILNALLLYSLIKKLFYPLAFPVALIFAIHPIGVETVAWASELKNLLALFFFLLSFSGYLKFLSTKKSKYYLLTIIAFIAAVFSKYTAVSFAFIPLLHGFWLKGKIKKRELKLSIPFILIGLLAGLNAVFTEIYNVGARGAEWSLSYLDKMILIGKTSLFYIYKVIYPKDFIFIYPRWQIRTLDILEWLPILTLLSLISLLSLYRKRVNRAITALFTFYLISIFPASGFFNVFPMKYSYVADHFSYLSTPWIILLFFALIYPSYRYLLKTIKPKKSIYLKLILTITLSITAIFLSIGSNRLTGNYKDEITLYKSIIAKNPGCWMANANLAILYTESDKNRLALKHYRDAIASEPNVASIYYNLGNLYYKIGDYDSAINSYMAAITSKPGYGESYANLANTYRAKGEPDKAIEHYKRALLFKPDAIVYFNLGNIYYQLGEYKEAMESYRETLKADPNYSRVHINLALSYYELKEYAKAKEHYRLALAADSPLTDETRAIFKQLP